MGEHNSPYFAMGCADGAHDTELIAQCPAQEPLGMDANRAWSWMYKRGYERHFDPGQRHECTRECRKISA